LSNSFQWTCPHCQRPQVVTNENYFAASGKIRNPPGEFGKVAYHIDSITCLNGDCGKMTFQAEVYKRGDVQNTDTYIKGDLVGSWQLMPESNAKPQPEYIPVALRTDYAEACRIRDLSPKASATLARRCLQGMIRDFCGIAKNRLIDEIRALREQLDKHTATKGVTHESVDAIDAVRGVGNIGAHMEKDVDLIVEIDPGEAQMLIDLIEMLFQEWYVERNKRTRRLAEIMALSAQKANELEEAKLAKLGPGPAIS
jgi:hypothetical protein